MVLPYAPRRLLGTDAGYGATSASGTVHAAYNTHGMFTGQLRYGPRQGSLTPRADSSPGTRSVSYTHLRAHETEADL
eukprot:970930-Rhodomonas_salina.6